MNHKTFLLVQTDNVYYMKHLRRLGSAQRGSSCPSNSVYNGQLFLAILYTYGHYFVANTIYKWSRLIGHKSIKMDRTSWKLLLI